MSSLDPPGWALHARGFSTVSKLLADMCAQLARRHQDNDVAAKTYCQSAGTMDCCRLPPEYACMRCMRYMRLADPVALPHSVTVEPVRRFIAGSE